MKQLRKMAAAAALGLLASGATFAQSPYSAPWRGDFWGYIGASAGESKFRTDCNRTITQFECDTKDTGFKVYAGGRMSEWLGLEIGYTDFGRIRASGGEVDAWAVPLTLITLANLYASRRASGALRIWWLAAALTALAERAFTFSYFIPTIVRLMNAPDSPESAAAALRWSQLNYLRHALVLAAWLASLRAFALFHQGAGRVFRH